MKNIKLGRSFKYGSMAVLLSVLVILAVLFVNIGLTILSDRLGLQADLTSDGRYAISQATYDLLKDYQEHVTIHVLATESDMRALTLNDANYQEFTSFADEIVETLKKYPVISNGKVDLEFVDIAKNPDFLTHFEGLGQVEEYSLILSNDNGKFAVIEPYNLYYWYYSFDESYENGYDPIGINVERAVAAALMNLDQDDRKTAVFMRGHGELDSVSGFAEYLQMNNFDVYTANLETDDLPENVDLMVILAPNVDYSEGMIGKIESYLKDHPDCKIFVALSPVNGEMTEIKQFISDYGISITNQVVYDTRLASGAANIAAVLSDSEEILMNMPSSANVILPYSFVLELNDGRPTGYESRSIATSSENSFSKVGKGENVSSIVKEPGDPEGPFDVIAISEQCTITDIGAVPQYNKILVLGSAYALSDEYFSTSKYSNQKFISAIMTDFFQTVDISAFDGHEFTVPQVVLLDWEKSVCLSVMCIIPILLLIAGIVVWMRRKNK